MNVKTSVKAGGVRLINHNATLVRMTAKTGVKAGGLSGVNHAQAAAVVRTGVKAGGLATNNHDQPASSFAPVSRPAGCRAPTMPRRSW